MIICPHHCTEWCIMNNFIISYVNYISVHRGFLFTAKIYPLQLDYLNTFEYFFQECIIHVHVYLKVHWILAVKAFQFYYIIHGSFFIKLWRIFFPIQYLVHRYYIFIIQFFVNWHNVYMYMYWKKHNTCICITLHFSMLTGNGFHQHSLS